MSAFYRISFELANSEDLRQSFAMTDASGAPLDLTGAALTMGLETAAGAGALVASTANGRIALVNAAAGQFELRIPASVMRTLTPGSYQHDLLLTFPTGAVRRVWAGPLMLVRGVAA